MTAASHSSEDYSAGAHPAGADSSAASPRRSPRTAAARRRRLLGILAVLTLVAAIAVGVGALADLPVPAWVVAIPGGLMVAYLLLLAVVRPGSRPVSRPARVEPGHLAADEEVAEPEPGVEGHAVHPTARPRELVGVSAGPAASVAGIEQRSAPLGAEPADTADASAPTSTSTWTPVPVPTPTYVTAPRARRAVRTIDLSNPGSWTASSGVPATTVGAPATSADAGDHEAQDDYVVEHRRAVGD